MSLNTVFSLFMVLGGIALISVSINSGLRLNHDLPAELRGRWQLMTAFMVFFDVGYLFFGFLLVTGLYFSLELLVGLILLGGAVFVFLFISLTEQTVSRLNETRRKVLEANEHLQKNNAALAEQISERSRISEELKQSRTHIENIFNNSIPLCLTNADFDIIDANDAYYRIFGRPSAGQPQKCFDSRPGSTCGTEDCPLSKIITGLASEVVCETRKEEMDGAVHSFLVTARPFRNEEGKVVGIVESFQDITRLKMAEEALAEGRERLLVTLKSIADGVITVDISGRVVLINDTAQMLVGWQYDEAVGMPLSEILRFHDAKDRRLVLDPVRNLLRHGTGEELDLRAIQVARDGWERHVSYSVSLIRGLHKDVVGVVLVFKDITEKLKVEAEAARIQKLESVSLLAGGIAHDFNNILDAIMNNLTMARLVKDSGEKLLEKIDSTEEAVFRAKELTGRLLTFAKGGNTPREVIALDSLVKSHVEFVLRGSNVASDIVIEEGLWAVEVDEVQMHQVISNLVINANQAMPDGGTIAISLANCAIRPDDSQLIAAGRYVMMAVRDQGHGISDDYITRIFDPYFTTKPEGSGLGLATVHSIISKHGGYILVDSGGGGTEFTIYLPAVQGEAGRVKQIMANVESNRTAGELVGVGGRIMIMDDEEDIRLLLGELLESAGFEVVGVRDGEEAVKVYREALAAGDKKFVCVIMDLTIPGGMGGEKTIAEMLKIDPEVKAIVSSGYANNPVMADYCNYGFVGRIVKPYRLEDLIEKINEIA